MFYLLPDLMECTEPEATKRGLIVTGAFDGVYTSDEEKDRLVNAELTRHGFTPSMEFAEYHLPPDQFVPWPQLHEEIPRRIKERLVELRERENG